MIINMKKYVDISYTISFTIKRTLILKKVCKLTNLIGSSKQNYKKIGKNNT
jgi:hypothetical protein